MWIKQIFKINGSLIGIPKSTTVLTHEVLLQQIDPGIIENTLDTILMSIYLIKIEEGDSGSSPHNNIAKV